MPSEAHKLSFLPVLASVVLVIGSLDWARAVFVPLAFVSHADFSVAASHSGAALAGSRLCSSSGAGRSIARTPYRSHWLGGSDAIIKPGVRASALLG